MPAPILYRYGIIIIIRNEEIYVAFSHKNCKDT